MSNIPIVDRSRQKKTSFKQKLRNILGHEEFKKPNIYKALFAEFLGNVLLRYIDISNNNLSPPLTSNHFCSDQVLQPAVKTNEQRRLLPMGGENYIPRLMSLSRRSILRTWSGWKWFESVECVDFLSIRQNWKLHVALYLCLEHLRVQRNVLNILNSQGRVRPRIGVWSPDYVTCFNF